MPSRKEMFWEAEKFAVVGNTKKKNFPVLTLRGLMNLGKTVYAVDPSVETVEGERAYPDFSSLPERVEAAVLETPKEDTADWVRRAADAGIGKIWIHMERDTPEALAEAEARGLEVETGTCAVMYVTPGFTYHALHRGVMKLIGQY